MKANPAVALAVTALPGAAGPATSWDEPGVIFLQLLSIGFLVALNGFFVASEFAIVKVRTSQLDALAAEGDRGAVHARQVTAHLDAPQIPAWRAGRRCGLSSCQPRAIPDSLRINCAAALTLVRRLAVIVGSWPLRALFKRINQKFMYF